MGGGDDDVEVEVTGATDISVRARSPVPVAAPGRAKRARSCVNSQPEANDSASCNSNSQKKLCATYLHLPRRRADLSPALYMHDDMD
jgi:hypothetical protein